MKKLPKLVSKLKQGKISQALSIKIKYAKDFIKILEQLYKEGFIQNYIVQNKFIIIYFRYYQGKNSIRTLKLLSKPSKTIYLRKKHLWLFNRSNGLLLLSTSQGLYSHDRCLELGLGGKVLIFVA